MDKPKTPDATFEEIHFWEQVYIALISSDDLARKHPGVAAERATKALYERRVRFGKKRQ
jgi:hypothetical protein